MGLVEMGEKEMLGEGSIRNKGSGMASGCIESPPRTVWALIKWKVGRDATGGWCRLAGYVLFHRQARHTAFQGQRSYAWRHATRCDFIEAFPALALCACSWVLNDKIPPPPPFISPLKPYSHFRDQLKLYFTPCSFLKTKFHIELSHPCSTLS